MWSWSQPTTFSLPFLRTLLILRYMRHVCSCQRCSYCDREEIAFYFSGRNICKCNIILNLNFFSACHPLISQKMLINMFLLIFRCKRFSHWLQILELSIGIFPVLLNFDFFLSWIYFNYCNFCYCITLTSITCCNWLMLLLWCLSDSCFVGRYILFFYFHPRWTGVCI